MEMMGASKLQYPYFDVTLQFCNALIKNINPTLKDLCIIQNRTHVYNIMLTTRGFKKKTLSYQMYTSHRGYSCQLHIQSHNPYETCIQTYYFELV